MPPIGELLTKICYEAGMPEDVLQCSHADIPELLETAADIRINGVNLTASVRAGQSIAKAAGFKKLLFELGGNDPLILLEDGNVKQAVAHAVEQRYNHMHCSYAVRCHA